MEPKLDEAFIEELGLAGLSEDKKRVLVQQLLETLQLRVGTRLSEDLTDEQLDAFDAVVESASDKAEAGAKWLEENHPHYKAIVNEETARLKDELHSNLDEVMHASQ